MILAAFILKKTFLMGHSILSTLINLLDFDIGKIFNEYFTKNVLSKGTEIVMCNSPKGSDNFKDSVCSKIINWRLVLDKSEVASLKCLKRDKKKSGTLLFTIQSADIVQIHLAHQCVMFGKTIVIVL